MELVKVGTGAGAAAYVRIPDSSAAGGAREGQKQALLDNDKSTPSESSCYCLETSWLVVKAINCLTPLVALLTGTINTTFDNNVYQLCKTQLAAACDETPPNLYQQCKDIFFREHPECQAVEIALQHSKDYSKWLIGDMFLFFINTVGIMAAAPPFPLPVTKLRRWCLPRFLYGAANIAFGVFRYNIGSQANSLTNLSLGIGSQANGVTHMVLGSIIVIDSLLSVPSICKEPISLRDRIKISYSGCTEALPDCQALRV